jgi:hypothetical protein
VWGNETQADEYQRLRDVSVPGISLGSCVDGLDEWTYRQDKLNRGPRSVHAVLRCRGHTCRW